MYAHKDIGKIVI